MKTTLTLDPDEGKITLVIDLKKGKLGKRLTVDEAEHVVQALQNAANETNRETFKHWLLQFESDADVLVVDGKTYRFKMVAEKEILTKFGHVTIPRRLYQQDCGGPSRVPLDEAWAMHDRFAASDVRESLLFLAAHLSPGETIDCLEKVGNFSCSKKTIQNIVAEMGESLEEHEDDLMETVRLAEELPVAETKCVAVSLDGVNVRLNVPGAKKGRPTERPKDEAAMSRETASCYKNAMVGVVSFYGEVPAKTLKNKGREDKTPRRLAARCVARMPEDKFPTFREKMEKEIRSTMERLPDVVTKILLNDGGTNLWTYADANPLFDGFEKLVDFHHVLDHLSLGAEGIFGKGTAEGKVWYRKMEGTLLSYANGAERVIHSLEYYRNGWKYSPSATALIEGCLTFMRNNAHRMEYKRFRDNGWPIGSGPVEGACKNIVKKRMCQSGQRWGLEGGQSILNLRVVVKSARWPLFWTAYKRHALSPKLSKPT